MLSPAVRDAEIMRGRRGSVGARGYKYSVLNGLRTDRDVNDSRAMRAPEDQGLQQRQSSPKRAPARLLPRSSSADNLDLTMRLPRGIKDPVSLDFRQRTPPTALRRSSSEDSDMTRKRALGPREIPMRTRWTTTEKSVRLKNACARFVGEGILGPMRGLFAGAHRHQQGEDDGGEQVWNYQRAVEEAPRDASAHSVLHSQGSPGANGVNNRRVFADEICEIFAADDSVLGAHDSTADVWDLSCPATLEITVLRARNIKAADWNGTSDPYVRLHVGSAENMQSRRTRTINGTLQPEWHETFRFEIEAASRLEHLTLECMDEDSQSADNSLGTASLALAPLKPNEQCQFWCRLGTTWHPVKCVESWQGLLVEVRCVLVPQPERTARTPEPRPGDSIDAMLQHSNIQSSRSSMLSSSFSSSFGSRGEGARTARGQLPRSFSDPELTSSQETAADFVGPPIVGRRWRAERLLSGKWALGT